MVAPKKTRPPADSEKPRPRNLKTGTLYTGPLAEEPEEKETSGTESSVRADAPLWRELRILVAAKLYGSERLSSERAAKLAGINHVEFLLGLGFYKVFPLQAELNELEEEREMGRG